MWDLNFERKFLDAGLKILEFWENKLLVIESQSNSYEFEVKNSWSKDKDEWIFIYELVDVDGLWMDEEYTYCLWDTEVESLNGLNSYLSMLVWLYESNELDEILGWFIEGSIQEEDPREVADVVEIDKNQVWDILNKETEIRDDKTWDLFGELPE